MRTFVVIRFNAVAQFVGQESGEVVEAIVKAGIRDVVENLLNTSIRESVCGIKYLALVHPDGTVDIYKDQDLPWITQDSAMAILATTFMFEMGDKVARIEKDMIAKVHHVYHVENLIDNTIHNYWFRMKDRSVQELKAWPKK